MTVKFRRPNPGIQGQDFNLGKNPSSGPSNQDSKPMTPNPESKALDSKPMGLQTKESKQESKPGLHVQESKLRNSTQEFRESVDRGKLGIEAKCGQYMSFHILTIIHFSKPRNIED